MSSLARANGRAQRAPDRPAAAASGAPRALRVAFYCRVSSEEQASAGTINNQLGYLREKYAAEFGPHAMNPMLLVGEYADDGLSGTLPLAHRPGGDALLAYPSSG
jgi:DNA invertase Pin-like site-specific DNA recombinase